MSGLSQIGQRRLLWIDDEKSPSDPDVVFLKRDGFHIDCAVTGSAGLAMARTGRYHGVLLDLRLPDLPGLAVLASLRAGGINVPVLVLTGFADFESARLAGSFGAAFKAKPFFVDDLQLALRELIDPGEPAAHSWSNGTETARDEVREELGAAAHLLEQIQRLTGGDLGWSGQQDSRHAVAAVLLRALANPALPMAAFLACARGVRETATSASESSIAFSADIEALVIEGLAKATVSNAQVARAITMLRSAAKRHQRMRLEEIAAALPARIDPARLGALVEQATGFYFTEWRTALLIRPSVRPLLNTTDDVKQIVRTLLAFKDLSHFCHEFHRFFGLSPTEFRRRWRSNCP